MAEINYDRDADVLYVSFGQREHVTGVELADNILLRLDTSRVIGDLLVPEERSVRCQDK